MPAVWHRHPRYVLSVVALLLTTLYLLAPQQGLEPRLHAYVPPRDNTLPSRISRAEQAYSRMLTRRRSMIKRYGPTAVDVVMFPPDKKPWPAYTVWDFFPSVFDCPHETDRIGNLGDGGKWLCGLSRIEDKPDCVVYTVGFSHETSFEREILERTTGCRIWAYDDQVNHFDVQSSQRHRTHFDHYLLSDVDAHGSKDNPKRYTLDALMRINNHTFIDVIKVDLEGGEFSTLSSFLHKYVAADEPVPFGQLLLEIHLWNKKFSEVLAFWELLETAGLRPFRSEPNGVYQNYNKQSDADLAEYSFVNIKGKNIFTADTPGEQLHVPTPSVVK